MFKRLGVYEVFKPGASLWILLGCHDSPLFKKINWRMKFLLCWPGHTPPENLLIPGHPLACKNILYLNSQDIPLCHSHWQNLKRPYLRLFLFEKKIKGLHSQWPENEFSESVDCVSVG